MVYLKWKCTDKDFPFFGQIKTPMPRWLAERMMRDMAARCADYEYWLEQATSH